MRYLIAGMGPAGAKAAEAIRARDAEGEIRILSEERVPPYFRASLPHYAVGKLTREQLWAVPDDLYEATRIQPVHARITKVDAAQARVHTEQGEVFSYDKLLVATGMAPRPLDCPGADLNGVMTLSTLDDADDLMARCAGGGRAVVTGGDFRALSICWVARRLGMEVTLLVPEHQVGVPWLDARGAQLLYRRLVEDGVEVRLAEEIAAVEGEKGSVAAVSTRGGKGIACRFVGVGLGEVPRTGAISGLKLKGDGTVPVGAALETSRVGIYAAGDVASIWDDVSGEHHSLGGWMTASTTGRIAGDNMAGGNGRFARSSYYHAGMLYDMPLTLIGRFGAAGDAEVTSSPNEDGYRRLVFREGKLIGATLLGDQWHGNVLRRVVELSADVRQHELQLLRTDVDLNHLLRPTGEYHLY